MTRAGNVLALARPRLSIMGWGVPAAATLVAVAIVRSDGDPALELRIAAVAVCVGAAGALDDQAREVLAPSPVSLGLRRTVAVALVLPSVLASWALVLASAGHDFGPALTVELGGMLAVTLAAAAVAVPRAGDAGAAVPAVCCLLAAVAAAGLFLPDDLTLFAAGPADPRWDASHRRWAGVLFAAVAALALASRDPARRRRPADGPRA